MRTRDYDRALAEATEHHANAKTYSGRFLRPHKPWLVALARRLDIRSALDYGCGKGEQYEWVDPVDGQTIEQAMGWDAPLLGRRPLPIRKFDPAYPPFAEEPPAGAPFDLVVCTHVLGSIPITDLDWVLKRIFDHAEKAVFIAEKIGPVKKKALSRPELRPVGWDAGDWLEVLAKYRRPGVELHFSANYRTSSGSFVGRFEL
jgi:hypothetical protein